MGRRIAFYPNGDGDDEEVFSEDTRKACRCVNEADQHEEEEADETTEARRIHRREVEESAERDVYETSEVAEMDKEVLNQSEWR